MITCKLQLLSVVACLTLILVIIKIKLDGSQIVLAFQSLWEQYISFGDIEIYTKYNSTLICLNIFINHTGLK